MNPSSILLLSLLGLTLVSAIIIDGGGGGSGGRRRKKPRFDVSSSALDSDSGSSEHHHHHHHRPPRAPRSTTTPKPLGCPTDWMTFNRPQGKWCVKVFYGSLNYDEAEEACKAQGAKLSGLQDAVERKQISDAARVLVNQNGGGFAQTWVGAKRKPTCGSRYTCPPLEAFEWLDGHTTGTGGFWWGVNQPDAFWYGSLGTQSCLVTIIHPSCDNCAAIAGMWHADTDDEHCGSKFRTYACGKQP